MISGTIHTFFTCRKILPLIKYVYKNYMVVLVQNYNATTSGHSVTDNILLNLRNY